MSFKTALQRIVKSLYASTIYIDWVQLWFLPHLFVVGLYASLFKYFCQISLFILLFHMPIQDFWGQKVNTVTGNLSLSIWVGFVMGVAGSVLIYELFIKMNPVALWWFGRRNSSA